VRWLASRLRIRTGARVLDLAAGTGKLTRMLLPFDASLLAVEPVEGMRRVFRSILPEVPVAGGRAEALPLRDRSIDVAVIAQAFHWFDAQVAIAELHRTLRPGGRVGLVWNVRDDAASPFWAGLTELLSTYRGDTPALRGSPWRQAFDDTELFTPLEARSFSFRPALARDQVIDRAMSISFIAALPDRERAEAEAAVVSLLDAQPETAGKRVVELPYRTDVYWTERRG
jgi:SAM-dependent methyltransferase